MRRINPPPTVRTKYSDAELLWRGVSVHGSLDEHPAFWPRDESDISIFRCRVGREIPSNCDLPRLLRRIERVKDMLFFHFVSNFIPEERLRARFHGFLHRVLTPSAVNKSP